MFNFQSDDHKIGAILLLGTLVLLVVGMVASTIEKLMGCAG